MVTRRSFSPRGARPRRKLVWADKRVEQRIPVTGTVLPDDLLDSYRTAGGNTQNVTIKRIILNLQWGETSNNAGTHADMMDFGLIVDSMAASGGRVSTPTTEPNVDWMWLLHAHPVYLASYAKAATAAQPAQSSIGHYTWDSRSSRTIEDVGSSLFLSNIWTITTAGAWDYSYHARILLALP